MRGSKQLRPHFALPPGSSICATYFTTFRKALVAIGKQFQSNVFFWVIKSTSIWRAFDEHHHSTPLSARNNFRRFNVLLQHGGKYSLYRYRTVLKLSSRTSALYQSSHQLFSTFVVFIPSWSQALTRNNIGLRWTWLIASEKKKMVTPIPWHMLLFVLLWMKRSTPKSIHLLVFFSYVFDRQSSLEG